MERKEHQDNSLRVEIACYGNDIRYLLTEEGIPLQDPCLWLDLISINSYLTGERYAYALLRYFKFLMKNKINYKEVVSKRVIEEYIKELLGLGEKIFNIESRMTFTALNTNITVLKAFYHWLEDEHKISNNPVHYTSRRSTKAPFVNTKLLYGQVWNYELQESVLNHITYRKKANHLKWYTEAEIQGIKANLLSLRDEVIFAISVETGMRIGEILGLKIEHFHPFDPSLHVVREQNIENRARAKTKERVLFINPLLSELIQTYLNTERASSNIYSSNYMFLNLSGVYIGLPLKSRNYLRILKDAAERYGLPRKEIRTHSGRSTRAQQLVELMRDNPDLGITPTFIDEELGWSSERTIKVYEKGYSNRQKKKIIERIQPVLLTKKDD
ncbi:integrase [Paenibacillus endophyticus]|uniref:Integrase n=1 Tax=Paenibacillus endophyticus TaxID=1294268 RepID=A0A7W5G9Z2_9BACL|nr:site-specific integrase [Paenibacillus endophyticus]MBB3152186.1 integrase [Paenibacillus endophyticus]